ncbi:unnamed protein product [Didymodactylos carnosus]|uniref:Uncharacterized protein n=1 Tax=Didymodactylos carnosus TaxID=1234261 RepID=A0A814G3Z2_9BILA|nr:unnamed protein product [Didymodactylos carnosus]CAF1222085.1 unnamed protein product [Didymodactylos carnosus]CAF3763446.1 unnamed protein product [Didymodactylos carnosus]CAF4030166.1 unnamed protein product [Didymodactylos carnosus]
MFALENEVIEIDSLNHYAPKLTETVTIPFTATTTQNHQNGGKLQRQSSSSDTSINERFKTHMNVDSLHSQLMYNVSHRRRQTVDIPLPPPIGQKMEDIFNSRNHYNKSKNRKENKTPTLHRTRKKTKPILTQDLFGIDIPLPGLPLPLLHTLPQILKTHIFQQQYQYPQHHFDQNLPSLSLQTDLRFLIIRHGERADRVFGPYWFLHAFDSFGNYHPFHLNLPPKLPQRSNWQLYGLDCPLTKTGMLKAKAVGKVLTLNNFQPHYIYSSPAMRCMQTAHYIVKGLDRQIPIRIEPGLLECINWNKFPTINPFLNSIEWHKHGVNVDLSYKPIVERIPTFENESAYYLRSKQVIREIEKMHNSIGNPKLNVLIVAHATSPETLTWDLVGRVPNPIGLFALSTHIDYLQMVITERIFHSKQWTMKNLPLAATTVKWI